MNEKKYPYFKCQKGVVFLNGITRNNTGLVAEKNLGLFITRNKDQAKTTCSDAPW